MSSVPALLVLPGGMCCAVGYSTAAATAAMRARMDHFRETTFIGPRGMPLIGAQLYDIDVWGPERLAWMFEHVLQQCLQVHVGLSLPDTALVLILPEEGRPGTDSSWAGRTAAACRGHRFHKRSRFYPQGKAGIGPALLHAREILAEKVVKQVLLIGVDSYFSASTINHYLARERLLCADNSDGFIPGEGAGAVLLRLAQADSFGLMIAGIAHAEEKAHWLQDDLPNRADGLRAAIKSAVVESGQPLANTLFHISDVSGEGFYFREAALGVSRSLEYKIPHYPHLQVANCLGETGAAVGPLMLGWLRHCVARGDGPGKRLLAHFSSDDGLRSACILQYRDPPRPNIEVMRGN